MKKLLSVVLAAAMMFAMTAAGFVSNGATGDPADTYTPITAPNEDPSIQMWFEHSTVKVHQEDTASTGRNTYSIYMAKNEIQGAQVILYSPNEDKSLLKASISENFTAMDGSGGVIPAELYYEFYVQTSNLFTTDIYGLKNAGDSFIREGMTPDAIAPIGNINATSTAKLGRFSLSAGKTQALYYRLKTASNTPSGWYSGTFELANSSGEIIKTATVYAYVWDFVIPEETSYQSAFYIGQPDGTTYKAFYDYLLENRLLGMNVPGELNSSNEYLSNPRVTAFRVAKHGSYLGTMTNDEISAVYSDLSQTDNWEALKEKAYFYTVDEPTSQEFNDIAIANGNLTYARPTVDTVNSEYNRISSAWADPYTVVPYNDNTPYPYNTYSKTLAANSNGTYATEYDGRAAFSDIKDSTQGMLDANSVTIWCPQTCAFTPREMLKSSGYIGTNTTSVHLWSPDNFYSGFNITNINACYFDWSSKYGALKDRLDAYQAERAAAGQNIKLWWYAGGRNKSYTYAYHNIENTGLQTEIMAWQAMQLGVTGYLYYGVDYWTEMGTDNYTPGSDVNYNGTAGADIWPVNKTMRDGYAVYGNGVLLYGTEMRSKLRLKSVDYVGTIRVEQLRDGVEDYEMLELYRRIYGEQAMQSLIKKISDNVACYLSLPLFDRSAYSSGMTNDDIFASVRIELGSAVEAGTPSCTEHVWDAGVVTKEPTTTEKGEKTYTCTVCGATKTEEIPATDPIDTGDVNGDGRINSKDILAVKKYIADVDITGTFLEAKADMDGNRRITAADVLALIKYLADSQ